MRNADVVCRYVRRAQTDSLAAVGLNPTMCNLVPTREGSTIARRHPRTEGKGVEPVIMRPKKVILCVDDNEQDLSVLSFMLATNGYRVLSALSSQEAIGIFTKSQVDLVLADFSMPQMNGTQLVRRLKQIAGHVPMILLGDPKTIGNEIHAADAMLAKKNCSALELLERIKVMSARKRGPRKGSHRIVRVEELAAAS